MTRETARFRKIVSVLIRHGLASGFADPTHLRLAFEELGPTFVKVGQMLSGRPDILPSEYLSELQKLQDRVTPEEFEIIRSTVESSIGRTLEDLFSEFNPSPLASGSIAQVHSAKLRDGTPVVVKVRRPGVRETMLEDLRILKKVATVANVAGSFRVLIPLEVIDEIYQTTEKELDFRYEASNVEKFRRNNEDVRFISVPRLFSEFTREDVLVIEHVDGIKITDLDALTAENYDLEDIGVKLATNYLKQIFEDGFFHADPHPGNIIIRDRRIVYLDFGMMGTIDDKLRQNLRLFLSGLVEGDISAMTRAAVRIGVPRGEVNRDNLRMDIERIYYDYADVSVSEIDIPVLANQVFQACRANNLTIPKDLTMLLRGIVTLQGVVARVAPAVNVMELAVPYARTFLIGNKDAAAMVREQLEALARSSRATAKLLLRLPEVIDRILTGRNKVILEHSGLDRSVAAMNRMVNRLVFGMILSALLIGSSILINARVGPAVWGLPMIGVIGYVGAAAMGVWLLISILRSGKM